MLNTNAIQGAIDELTAKRDEIDAAIGTLKGLLGNIAPAAKNGGVKP